MLSFAEIDDIINNIAPLNIFIANQKISNNWIMFARGC